CVLASSALPARSGRSPRHGHLVRTRPPSRPPRLFLPARLAGVLDGCRVAGQDAVELAARGDAELGEDLAQVVLDRVCADEQTGADLRIRQPLAGQPGDLRLLGRQLLMPGGLGALADSPAGG